MPLDQWEALVRVLVAAALTGLIGAEREIRGKAAGLRTFTMVGVGAAIFTVVGPLLNSGGSGDATRIAAQVASGVGFIGAGLIFRQGAHTKNLTTAAGIWASAAIGVACGAGFFILATGATLLMLFALTLYRAIEQRIERPGQPMQREDTDDY